MADKRWRILVEYENRNELGVGVVPGEEKGESPKNRELVAVLRIVADEIESSFEPDGDAPQVLYPPHEEEPAARP